MRVGSGTFQDLSVIKAGEMRGFSLLVWIECDQQRS